jgi:vacuolar-type H+-ATPase subunit E/Vma4
MVHLDLNSNEAEILLSALHSALSDLSYEISSTDLQDYRDELKERRAVLQNVVQALNEVRQPA